MQQGGPTSNQFFHSTEQTRGVSKFPIMYCPCISVFKTTTLRHPPNTIYCAEKSKLNGANVQGGFFLTFTALPSVITLRQC